MKKPASKAMKVHTKSKTPKEDKSKPKAKAKGKSSGFGKDTPQDWSKPLVKEAETTNVEGEEEETVEQDPEVNPLMFDAPVCSPKLFEQL